MASLMSFQERTTDQQLCTTFNSQIIYLVVQTRQDSTNVPSLAKNWDESPNHSSTMTSYQDRHQTLRYKKPQKRREPSCLNGMSPNHSSTMTSYQHRTSDTQIQEATIKERTIMSQWDESQSFIHNDKLSRQNIRHSDTRSHNKGNTQ